MSACITCPTVERDFGREYEIARSPLMLEIEQRVRGAAYRRKARACHMVTAQPHLVAPVDLGALALGLPGQRRVDLAAPLRDGFVGALVGTAHGLLRRHAPRLQVAAHRRQRQLGRVLALDQRHDRLPSPQVKRQLELIGHLADDDSIDARLLHAIEQASTRGATPLVPL